MVFEHDAGWSKKEVKTHEGYRDVCVREQLLCTHIISLSSLISLPVSIYLDKN